MQIDSDEHHGPPIYESGWWPEIAGFIAVAALCWFLAFFAEGFI